MKKEIQILLGLFVCGIVFGLPVFAGEASEDEGIHSQSDIGVKGLEDRIRRLEEQLEEKPLLGKLGERFILTGLIEVEASFESIDSEDPEMEGDASDLVLAAVELGIDVEIARYVSGHILFLWEEDDTEPVDIDEGFIIIDGEDVAPVYVNAGKMYVPFGFFESHFISDPLTLELGETRESAVRIGFLNQSIDVSLAAFNGDVEETGGDDHIENVAFGASLALPETAVPGLGVVAGASYISSIADSDVLEAETAAEVEDYVGGLGGFVRVSFMERFFLIAEYVGAMDEFEAGELNFDGGETLRPSAWNFEFAFLPADDWEVAVKYERGEELGNLLPEEQYGCAVAYGLFENTALALEYLHGEFENHDERDLVTSQLAVEF